MGIQLDQVVPWGRSLDEYIRMFNLTPLDLQKRILDCAGGPASFNTELNQRNTSLSSNSLSSNHPAGKPQVMSCDSIYGFSISQIEQRIADTYNLLQEKLRTNLEAYHWRQIQSPEQLGEIRMAAMRQFLQDFPQGLEEGRYQVESLPSLPYGDHQFDLALCSHFLFTYSAQFSESFHLDSIHELCRVAAEVRIFPLLKVSGEPSPFVTKIVKELQAQGDRAEIEAVNYEFQKGGNQLLRCWKT